jgi:hypothetical protein
MTEQQEEAGPLPSGFAPLSNPLPEDVIAADLHALTFQERQAITDEIHGVGNSGVEETVERVQEALRILRDECLFNSGNNSNSSNSSLNTSSASQRIPLAKRQAYDRAVFLRPLLEVDDKLHLMFLRAQRFDPYKAAQHMCIYFENKRALFGDELLTQKITLKDLTDHEVKLVQEGVHQLLAGRERSGRGICVSRIGQWDLRSPLSFMRSIWYIMTDIEDNEEMQRKGVVMIGDWQGPFRHSLYEIFSFMNHMQPFMQTWTFRTESVHTLYNNAAFDAFFKTLAVTMPKDLRLRHRFHFGSQLEIIYSLRTFGIDMGDGHIGRSRTRDNPPGQRLETMDEYLQRRSRLEDQWREAEKPFQKSSAAVALLPNPQDILMGRSKIAANWPGNLLYHNIVAQYVPRYMDPVNKDRIDKTLIAMEVIHALHTDYGSRFLSRKENRWVVAEDAEIKKKVSQSLRIEAKGTMGKQQMSVSY